MSKKIIVFGTSCFSIMLKEYVERFMNREVVAYAVNKNFIKENYIDNIPVVAFEDIEFTYNPEEYSFINAMGYMQMNCVRERIANEIKNKGYELENFIHPSAMVYTKEIGEGNIILENVFVGPHTIIGNGNIIWNGVNISHDGKIGDFNCFAASTTIAGNVEISNNCFFGINCSIKNDINISSKTLIGAGCFLNKNTEEEDVYVLEKPCKKMNIKSMDICNFII